MKGSFRVADYSRVDSTFINTSALRDTDSDNLLEPLAGDSGIFFLVTRTETTRQGWLPKP